MSSQYPLISIAVPAYNAGETLAAMIDSVLAQTYQNFELIICDDASTDATPEIAKSYGDPRIRLISNAVNMGEGGSRDRALATANGTWIALIDADDAWDPRRLDHMFKASNTEENSVVFDDIMECHSVGTTMVPWRRMRGRRAFGARNSPVQISMPQWIDSSRMFLKMLFSRQLLRSTGAMHSGHAYGADAYFALKLLSPEVSLIYLPEPLYLYRIAPGSASGNPQRNTLLRGILEVASDDFVNYPDVQAALRRKIKHVQRRELYTPFATAIKEGRVVDASHLVVKRPSLLGEFMVRGVFDLPYHFHRLHRGGSTRGRAK